MTLKINRLAILFSMLIFFSNCKKETHTVDSSEAIIEDLAETRLHNEFLIRGTTFSKNLERIFLYKVEQDSLIPIDTISVIDKTFAIKGYSEEPAFYALKTDDSNELFRFLVDASEINMFLNANLYLSSTSSDSKLQNTYQSYLAKINGFDYRERDLFLKYKTQRSRSKRASLLNSDLELLQKEKIDFIHDFITSNNTSLFIPLVFNEHYYSFSTEMLRKMHDTLSDSVKELSSMKAINARIVAQETAEDTQEQAKSNTFRPKAYTLSGPNTLGQTISLEALRGNVVLVDFWASWCAPCRATNPNLVQLYNKYKHRGFVVLSVSEDKGSPEWISAIHADNLNWDTHILDANKRIAFRYGVESIPYKILIDKQGRIASGKISGSALEHRLVELLNE